MVPDSDGAVGDQADDDPEFLREVKTPAGFAAAVARAEAGDLETMANLGVYLFRSGDHTHGISWTERAWKAGSPGAGFNLGTFYLNSGDTNRADLVWTSAAEHGDPDAMMCVARLALERDDMSAASRWLEPLLRQDEPYPITALGVAYRDHGDHDMALRIFDRSIALGDAYAMEYAARIHEHNGDATTAGQLRARAVHSKKFR